MNNHLFRRNFATLTPHVQQYEQQWKLMEFPKFGTQTILMCFTSIFHSLEFRKFGGHRQLIKSNGTMATGRVNLSNEQDA